MANILQHAKSVSEFESKDVQWVIPYWIPKGAITLLAGTGGIGKPISGATFSPASAA